MDLTCIITAILFFGSSATEVALKLLSRYHTDISQLKQLDVTYIKEMWEIRSTYAPLHTIGGLLSAVAWFALCVLIVQVAWILSKEGRRHLGLHALIVMFATGGSIAELLCKLMAVGVANVAEWIVSYFNLDDWVVQGDGTGWRVMEMGLAMSKGLIFCLDSLEYFALFAVLALLYGSASSDREQSFGKKWAFLGFVIGMLSLFTFMASLLDFEDELFFIASVSLLAVNTMVLFPIWLVILAFQLPNARPKYEDVVVAGDDGNLI